MRINNKQLFNQKYLSLTKSLFVVIALIILGALSHYKVISELPQGIHRWSQSDHYAIAVGYEDNNLNLFKPQSYLLNPPIVTPHIDSLQGITRVDFPLYHYLVGVTMKVASCSEPFVQRIISLIISLIGLFFLYKLVEQHTKSFWNAFIIIISIFGFPVYLYYQCNFLPSVPGISLCFIGYYFYFNYLSNRKNFKYFLLSITFFFLATLFRLPLAIPLIAISCQQLLSFITNRKIIWKEILALLSAFLLLGIYYLYNCYLGDKYGSIFLNGILPATSFEEFNNLLSLIYELQYRHQFSEHIKLFILILVLNAVAFTIYSIIKKKSLTKFQKQVISQAGITFIGGLFYFFLMIKQFSHHDYYFIDSLYIGFILFTIFLITFIKWDYNKINISLKVFLLILLCFSFHESYRQQIRWLEFQPYESEYYFEQNLSDIQFLLNKHDIKNYDLIYVMDEKLPANTIFCRLKRKGFCWDGYERIHKWIPKVDYIFCTEQSLINDIFKKDYTLRYELDVIDKYGTIVLLKKADNAYSSSPYQVSADSSAKMYELNFDEMPLSYWDIRDDVIKIDDTNYFYVAHVFPEKEYTSGFALPVSMLERSKPFYTILAKLDFMSLQDDGSAFLVVCVNRCDTSFIYNSINISGVKNKWEKTSYLLTISGINPNTDKFVAYLWNNRKSEFYYDNFKIYFY